MFFICLRGLSMSKRVPEEEEEMNGPDSELSGFLDAKLPTSRGRKRSLAPWKAWHRHLCAVRKLGPGLGVQVQLIRGLGRDASHDRDNSIKVPADSIICRTESTTKQFAFGIFPVNDRKPLLYLNGTSESETQSWMASLRQLLRPRRHRFMEGTFDVSLVDNGHSRAAGLTGLHGDLAASHSGIFIKDVHTGEIIEHFEWQEMHQFHLSTSGRPEDVRRICVFHTTKHFRAGVGELHVFCRNAENLLQVLVTQGRGPRRKNQATRPLSLSDSDLTLTIHQDSETDLHIPVLKSKAASSLINAGLFLSARSGSEAKLLEGVAMANAFKGIGEAEKGFRIRAMENLYERHQPGLSRINSNFADFTISLPRRKSNVSLASGIYDEIGVHVDDSTGIPSNIYENCNELYFPGMTGIPPPLPPRKRCCSESTGKSSSISDDGMDSEGGTRSATPNTQEDSGSTYDERHLETIPDDLSDSHYVPMSPRIKDLIAMHKWDVPPAEEEVYMVMR